MTTRRTAEAGMGDSQNDAHTPAEASEDLDERESVFWNDQEMEEPVEHFSSELSSLDSEVQTDCQREETRNLVAQGR